MVEVLAMEGQDVPCTRCLVLEARIAELEKLVAELLERLDKNSSNSSKPPSSNPPWIKPSPPKPKSGRKRGGQPAAAASSANSLRPKR